MSYQMLCIFHIQERRQQMPGKREQLETLNMWGQKLTREEGLTNTDKDNIHKDLALINERFNKVK